MTSVFLVHHVRSDDEYGDDAKLIGVYATRDDADAAVDRLRSQQGFRDHPNGWQVAPWQLNVDRWETGFSSVPEANLVLLHCEATGDNGFAVTISAESPQVDCLGSTIFTHVQMQDFSDRCAARPLADDVILAGSDADGRFTLSLVPSHGADRVTVTLTTESASDASAETRASVAFEVTDRDVAHFASRLRHVLRGPDKVAALRSSSSY